MWHVILLGCVPISNFFPSAIERFPMLSGIILQATDILRC
jgi:hypothetical protein